MTFFPFASSDLLANFDLHAETFLTEFHQTVRRKGESANDSIEKKVNTLISHQTTENPHGSWRYQTPECISLALHELFN